MNSVLEAMTYKDKIAHMLDWNMDPQLYSSLICMLIVLILAIIVGIKARRASHLEKPKGLLLLAEWFYELCHRFTVGNMGETFEAFTGYFMVLMVYLFLGFNWGLTGLPSFVDWLAAPLSLAIIMFVFIHITAIRYQKLRYFRRYTDPFPLFLPMNLISMWSPIISTTMRMFGNCLSGTIVIGLIQWSLAKASSSIFAFMPYYGSGPLGTLIFHPEAAQSIFPGSAGIWIAGIPSGILNLYFSLFSGFIQTTVFCYLNALWIAAEKPAELDVPGQEGVIVKENI